MTREIKFRGKSLDNGKWEIGNLLFAVNGTPYILPPEICEVDGHHIRQGDDVPHRVDPATVGQFTGIKDKNGVEIYDGDIMSIACTFGYNRHGFVRFVEGVWVLQHKKGIERYEDIYPILFRSTVIGNIYDNANLLKGGNE